MLQTWTEEKLDQLLATPSQRLIEDMKQIQGDIMLLGAGGKMGPTLALWRKMLPTLPVFLKRSMRSHGSVTPWQSSCSRMGESSASVQI